MSDDPRLLCEEVCMLYGLAEKEIPATTKPLGPVFIREMALKNYPTYIMQEIGVDISIARGIAYEVNRRIFLRFPEYFTDAEALGRQWEAQKAAPSVSLEEAKQKVLELEPWLLERDEEDEDESGSIPTEAAVRLPLLRAVGEYPNIGNQQITRERIRLQGRQDTVRPSLANWVKSYRNELGVGYHEPVVRAKFLFDSENGKKLTSEERERLNVIIRSIEENEPVEIDTERAEIVFPESRIIERAPKPEARVTAPRSAPVMGAEHIGQAPPKAPSRPLVKPAPGFSDSRPRPVGASNAPVAPSAPRRNATMSPAAPPDLPVSGNVSQSSPAPAPRPVGGTVSFSSSHALPGERPKKKGSYIRYGRAPRPQAPPDPKRSASPAPSSNDGRVVDLRGE